MSLMEDCFSRTIAAKGRVCGEQESINIGGVDYDALVDILTATEVMVAGGTGKAGGFKAQVRISDFSAEPKKFTQATVRGETLQVLDTNDVNGIVYLITMGDPIVE